MSQRLIRPAFTLMLILASTAMLASHAAAQSWSQSSNSWGKQTEWFQYPVKFVCGTAEGDPLRLVPGRYATAVNLFNPNSSEATCREHLALAFPPAEQATGEISDVIEFAIPAGAALQVDCEEILNEFVFQNPPDSTDLLEGFFVLECNKAVHAESVYSAAGESGDVSIDVEKVTERKATPMALLSKVKICHYPPGNPGNRHEITIDASALPAHKAHGDTVGACPNGDS